MHKILREDAADLSEMMGMKVTNKKVEVQGIDYLYFKNGKATEHWGYIDMHKLMEQLGMGKDK